MTRVYSVGHPHDVPDAWTRWDYHGEHYRRTRGDQIEVWREGAWWPVHHEPLDTEVGGFDSRRGRRASEDRTGGAGNRVALCPGISHDGEFDGGGL